VNRTQHRIRPSDCYTQCANLTWTLEQHTARRKPNTPKTKKRSHAHTNNKKQPDTSEIPKGI